MNTITTVPILNKNKYPIVITIYNTLFYNTIITFGYFSNQQRSFLTLTQHSFHHPPVIFIFSSFSSLLNNRYIAFIIIIIT